MPLGGLLPYDSATTPGLGQSFDMSTEQREAFEKEERRKRMAQAMMGASMQPTSGDAGALGALMPLLNAFLGQRAQQNASANQVALMEGAITGMPR